MRPEGHWKHSGFGGAGQCHGRSHLGFSVSFRSVALRVGLLVWEAEEGVLVAPGSWGANFLYLSLKKVLGNSNCSILECPVFLESLEQVLPFPCQKLHPLGVYHRELIEYCAAEGQQDGQEELSPIFLCCALV